MNRCFQLPMHWLSNTTLASLVVLTTLTATPLAAQGVLRQFPSAALRGTLQVTTPPDILINGQPGRLSPGARIKGTSNTLVMSASLAGQTLQVNYLRDGQGLVHEVWLLSESEAQEKRASE